MRHKKKTIILDRKSGPRRALLRTLCISLIQHGSITTTPAKAKAVQSIVERCVTAGKKKSLASIRLIEKRLSNKRAAERVVHSIAPRFALRTGGYTTLMKVAPRKGDNAPQVVLQFVDHE